MTPNQSAVYRVIEQCAAAGDVLPIGAAIAERAGLRVTSVASALYQLVDRGVIVIDNVGHGKRVVTILATGAATGMPAGHKPRSIPAENIKALVSESRFPCPWCETRSDIGCEHLRRAA